MNDFPCEPMNGGCRALAKAVGELQNDKASKKWVDEQMREAREERSDIKDSIESMKAWLMATCVSALLAIVIMLGRTLFSILGK